MRAMRREPHAIQRVRERYNLWINIGDLRVIEADAAAGRTILLSRAPGGVTRHAAQLGGVVVVAVIGADGRCVTVLPREALRKRQAAGQ